jgi:hypothetical protein
MDNGIYTVEKNSKYKESSEQQKGTFTAYTYIKITAPSPHLLECNLKQSDASSYEYYTDGSNDSVAVFSANDTLYIQYIPASENKSNGNGFGKITVNVNLPAISHLAVDGAMVILQSPFADVPAFSVSLKNKGMIKDESKSIEPAETENPDTGKAGKEGFRDNENIRDLAALKGAKKILNQPIKEVLIYHLL